MPGLLCSPRPHQHPRETGLSSKAVRRGTSGAIGEQVECSATPGNGATVVAIRSRPALTTTMVDYGKNRENVERIRAYMARQTPYAPAPQA